MKSEQKNFEIEICKKKVLILHILVGKCTLSGKNKLLGIQRYLFISGRQKSVNYIPKGINTSNIKT